MSSVVACFDHCKGGVTSCCYLIIASFISADSKPRPSTSGAEPVVFLYSHILACLTGRLSYRVSPSAAWVHKKPQG